MPILELKFRILNLPVSITYRTPLIVIEVSAILVARMTFRVSRGAGSNTFACFSAGKAANIGHGIICERDETKLM